MPRKGWHFATIYTPLPLLHEVDVAVQAYGYDSRSEFTREAWAFLLQAHRKGVK